MDENSIIGLLVATLGLLFIRFGWALPFPGNRQITNNQVVGLLLTILLFFVGLWLMVWGLAQV